MIYLFDLMCLEGDEERFEDGLVLGNEEASTRISVDTMDESRTKCEAIILSLQIVLYLIDDIGFCRFMISCMDIDPSGLIHDHEVFILVEDVECS
jgi:hypothetical protein